MITTTMPTVRPRKKGAVRITPPPVWCGRCGWAVTDRASGRCQDCDGDPSTGTVRTSRGVGHLRRLLVARLLVAAERPMISPEIARTLGMDPKTVLYAMSGSSLFTRTPDGYGLSDAGRELVRRYLTGGDA